MKEKLIELFTKVGNETDTFAPFVTSDQFEDLADEIVKLCNLQNVMASVSDTLLLKASEYEDEANADFDTEGVQHNLNIGRYDGLMQAVQEINKHLS